MESNAQTAAVADADKDEARGIRKILVGKVVSDKMDKTVVVEVKRTFQHTHFKKYVQTRKRYKAHDETNQCKVGDKVQIVESRPLSKQKRWRIKAILS
jgi:small subunit ribosomal protein S17